MSDWTAGYVADIGYTYGYYSELNPLNAVLPLATLGYAMPRWRTACELGFGQGISANMHAAAGGIEWWGTDFNPDQAAFAQGMAAGGGSGARLFDQSFAEFAARDDLPGFDFIGLHGIWSWVSPENRATIVDFIRRKLNVGGLLYISYNTLPGWAPFMPLRELMVEYAQSQMGAGVPTAERVKTALGFVDNLLAAEPALLQALPHIKDRVAKIKTMDAAYVAHEYFNRDWQPMTFSQMAEHLRTAKLGYVGQATHLSYVGGLHTTPQQQAVIDGVGDPVFRETVRDYVTNQQFRRDYWVRGARRLSAGEMHQNLFRTRVLLVRGPGDVSMDLNVPGRVGKVQLQQAVYEPLLEVLAQHRPIELGALARAVQPRGLNFPQVLQAILILASRADVCVVQDDEEIARAKPRVDAMNRWVLQQSRGSAKVESVACAVSGGAIGVGRLHLLSLDAWVAGARTPEALVDSCVRALAANNERVKGPAGEDLPPEQAREQLHTHAKAFLETGLPVLQRLGAVPD